MCLPVKLPATWLICANLSSLSRTSAPPPSARSSSRPSDHEFEVGCHISNFHMHIRRYARPTEPSHSVCLSLSLLPLASFACVTSRARSTDWKYWHASRRTPARRAPSSWAAGCAAARRDVVRGGEESCSVFRPGIQHDAIT